ncbi:MAG: hypothetical protein M1339_07235 [Bacteroidetes bacterium]|nr:hypothetical protein [Bacteroidota bacterium]
MKNLIVMMLAASFLAVGSVFAQTKPVPKKRVTKTEMTKKAPKKVMHSKKGTTSKKMVMRKKVTKGTMTSHKLVKKSTMMTKKSHPVKHMVSKKPMVKKTKKGTGK